MLIYKAFYCCVFIVVTKRKVYKGVNIDKSMKNKILPLILTGAIGAGCSNIKFGKRSEDVLNQAYQAVNAKEAEWAEIARKNDDWEDIKEIRKLVHYLKDNGEVTKLKNINLIIYSKNIDNNTTASYIDRKDSNILEIIVINPNCKEDKKYCRDSFYDEGANGFNNGDGDLYHSHKITECEDCNGKQRHAVCYHVNDFEHRDELAQANEKYFKELRKINEKIEQIRSRAKSAKIHNIYKRK